MAILELDIGNTRSKWRLLENDKAVARGALINTQLRRHGLPQSLQQQLQQLRPKRARAANVAGAEMGAFLQCALREQFDLSVEFARVQPSCAGVECGYREVQRLGVDRWLAVLAVHQRSSRAALIVDCGSAVTLDILDTGGRHLGGYILPGLQLMRRALFSDTDAVKVAESFASGMSLAPGTDTETAVNQGLPLMVLGAIEQAFVILRAQIKEEPLLWLTGGDGALFSSLCQRPHQWVEELVLDGLAVSNP
jgi:type III pantothenate kinase